MQSLGSGCLELEGIGNFGEAEGREQERGKNQTDLEAGEELADTEEEHGV